MIQSNKGLSNLSYTNKDFGEIYPELLDLAKKISYKWDPTQSDESDPGVVLLKLAALMTDKTNYNIDKNILETFPLSVTQLHNARQLFEQCGYCMRYYTSATTKISMTLVSNNEPAITDEDLKVLLPNESIPVDTVKEDSDYSRTYVIPKFTMISDMDNSTIYTITDEVKLNSSGITIDDIPAIQGTINRYSINGETNITAINLDYKHRLYFSELDIPENGIFIEDSNNDQWERVDNLMLQPNGTKCYKFGLTHDGSSVYLEFPEDIDTLIGKGISIRYIRTLGADGCVSKKRLQQFYPDVKARRYINELYSQEVTVTTYTGGKSGNVYLTNATTGVGGKNPETIDEAYKSYQRIKTTFETLVSLRDYTNYFITNENVSNCVVCDRTNDIQSAYKVIDASGGVVNTNHYIHQSDNAPELNAFNLKLYGLTFVDNPTTTEGFNRSFSLITPQNVAWKEIQFDVEDIKSLQHDFSNFEKNRPLLLMNRYPIVCKIIPQYKLEASQQTELTRTIIYALYKLLNSRSIEFGASIDYESVYDTIMAADPRIKAITLDTFEYATFALYVDEENNVKELQIDANSIEPQDATLATLWNTFRTDIYAKSVLAGKTPLFISNDPIQYSLNQNNSEIAENIFKLTTGTTIDLEFYPERSIYSSKQLDLNENVMFLAPNLIDDTPYSSYVKVIHNIGNIVQRPTHESKRSIVVKKDADYTLKEGEYIIFFWKSEDDANAPYRYTKYTHSTTINTISPNHNLLTQRQPKDTFTIPESTLSQLPEKGTTEYLVIQYADTEMSLTDYIGTLDGDEYVLDGLHTITSKRVNKVHINAQLNGTKDIYWILNNRSSESSTAVERTTLFRKGESRYILQDGEYFIYSNSTRTQLNILGSGTEIQRDVSNVNAAWSCDVVNYDTFLSEGIHYLDDKWFRIPEGDSVFATEMKFYQMGPGSVVVLKPKEGVNTQKSIKLVSDNFMKLSNYYISCDTSDGQLIELPDRSSSDYAWKVKTLYNLTISPDTPQHVNTHQYVRAYMDESDNIYQEFTNVDLLANRPISVTGGELIDVTQLDLSTNEILPLTLYKYNPTLDTEHWKFNAAQTTLQWEVVDDNNLTFEDELNCCMPSGRYILPMQVTSSLESLEVLKNSEIVSDVKGCANYTTVGTHYLMFNVNTNSRTQGINLKIQTKCSKKGEYYIKFLPLFKCDLNSSAFDETEIINRIVELDIDNIYNYTYTVPEADRINNPLLSQSFLDSNHIFNEFTICKWDTNSSNNTFAVLNKIK